MLQGQTDLLLCLAPSGFGCRLSSDGLNPISFGCGLPEDGLLALRFGRGLLGHHQGAGDQSIDLGRPGRVGLSARFLRLLTGSNPKKEGAPAKSKPMTKAKIRYNVRLRNCAANFCSSGTVMLPPLTRYVLGPDMYRAQYTTVSLTWASQNQIGFCDF